MATTTTITEKAELENSLGIPKAIFLEDVEKFMQEDNKSAEVVIRKLEELFQKYRVMEVSSLQKKERLKIQIPDIKMSLGTFLIGIFLNRNQFILYIFYKTV